MFNMAKEQCEHILGLIYKNDEASRLVTFEDLKRHIEQKTELKALFEEYHPQYEGFIRSIKLYSIADYADKRRSTDLHRFDFCPKCGKKIGWKELKKEAIQD